MMRLILGKESRPRECIDVSLDLRELQAVRYSGSARMAR